MRPGAPGFCRQPSARDDPLNMKQLPYALLACLPALAPLGCSGTSDVVDRSREFARQQNYFQAYRVLDEVLQTYPEDPELAREFWNARLNYLVAHGQELVFEEKELLGIQEFQKALVLDPKNPDALAGIERANQKLASRRIYAGDLHLSAGEYEEALKEFHKATSYVPEHPEAIQGIKDVNEKYQDRAEKAAHHYTLGSRARGEQEFRGSFYHYQLAESMDPSLPQAKARREAAGRWLASERYEWAKEMESKGHYAAALHEYREVVAVLPDAEGLDQRIKAMEGEVRADELTRTAKMKLRQNEFDAADKALNEAFEHSTNERASINGLMREARRYRLEHLYRQAKDLELEDRYEEALIGYREIDSKWEEAFRDVKNRISSLENAIAVATRSYESGQEAEAKGDTKQAIDHYANAHLVYRNFRDVAAKLARLRGR